MTDNEGTINDLPCNLYSVYVKILQARKQIPYKTKRRTVQAVGIKLGQNSQGLEKSNTYFLNIFVKEVFESSVERFDIQYVNISRFADSFHSQTWVRPEANKV